MKTREEIADKIVELIQKDVDANIRETDGKNRSPLIDSFNERVGVALGSPYCASASWCRIDDACKELGLKNPVPKTAGSQSFRHSPFVPKAYIRPPHSLGQKGDAAIFQVVGNESQGHYATVRENQATDSNSFKTLEYNTDGSGSRDGDGAYDMTRHVDGRTGNKFFICFTDIPQWIYDHNYPQV